jgi:hypothetical protein
LVEVNPTDPTVPVQFLVMHGIAAATASLETNSVAADARSVANSDSAYGRPLFA